ncbi:hypothetical protein F5Y05DRAFT_269100 [Hypoxylon sp. FL0543]|nr:hypothetical protein F5Y05DRAFT_269100 [Hypoxylon sp. FL0543]
MAVPTEMPFEVRTTQWPILRDRGRWWSSFRPQVRDTVMKQPPLGIQAFIIHKLIGIRPVHAPA